MFVIAIRILFILLGATFFLGGIDGLIQLYNFPVAKKELLVVSGTLSAVSVCPSGRNSTFKFNIMKAHVLHDFSLGCPSAIYTKLRESIGEKVQMSYHKERGAFFMHKIDVYALDINESPFKKYEDRVAHHNKVMPYTISLSILSGFLGLVIIRLTQTLDLTNS